jgi:phosphatidylglycerophosphate synthase
MLNERQSSALMRLSPTSQLSVALLMGIFVVIAVASLFVGADLQALGFALGSYLVGGLLALGLIRRGYPHSLLGKGNLVTLFRMAVVAALLAPVIGNKAPWLLVVLSVGILVLDGVDGRLARREGRVSDFGARLDMEIDSILAVVLALNVWAAGMTGAWVLLLALPRYLFIAAAWFLPWLKKPLPPSLARRVICVVQVACLIGLNAPIFPWWMVVLIAASVAGSLSWSFGRDILWLWRNRV